MPRTPPPAGRRSTARRQLDRRSPAARAPLVSRSAAVLLAALAAACGAETEPEDVSVAAQPVEEANAWAVTAEPMNAARHTAAAARLPGGRVLIAGGIKVGAIDTGDVVFESAELFDPVAEQFLSVGATMSTKRAGHVAEMLSGGRVLVAGGNGGPVATAEIFLASMVTWQPTADLARPRSRAASVVLMDGRALVTGGDLGSASAEVLDPAALTWAETGPMVLPRRLHTATLLLDGRVLVAGGQRADDPNQATADAEMYDPATGAWSSVAPMAAARLGHTATRLPDGRVLVAGGSSSLNIHALGQLASAEVYDPAADTWTTGGSMIVARALHTATALDNGAVLVAGGVDATSSALRGTELFDPDRLQWVAAGLMTHGRFRHVAAPLADGAVLVAGGEFQSSAEVYRPAAIGQRCEVGRQCESGFCVDGVCCDAECEGDCATCALPGAEGTCQPAALGTDPRGRCGEGGTCDKVCGEAGECVSRVGQGCVAPECISNRTRAILAAMCETDGGDCPRVAVDCAPYRCGPTGFPLADGCLKRCASIDDCAPGFACDPEGTCRLRPDVAASDPEACAASSGDGGRAVVTWLAGLALAVGALRLRRRPR